MGVDRDGLAGNTLAATAIGVDGRSAAIPGTTRPAPTETIGVAISRCWLLNVTNPQKGLPAGLRLTTAPIPQEPPDGWTAEQWAELMSGNHGLWAAIAVNAWVKQLAAQGLILFYSADDDNIASHRVAQKCKATPLGHLIHITPAVTAG